MLQAMEFHHGFPLLVVHGRSTLPCLAALEAARWFALFLGLCGSGAADGPAGIADGSKDPTGAIFKLLIFYFHDFFAFILNFISFFCRFVCLFVYFLFFIALVKRFIQRGRIYPV